ncbi:MAG: response regulator transcription factor [Nitrosopumilaceae archaeon]
MIGVIVIDDEHDVSEVLCEFLKLKDIKVLGRGKNGEDAIQLYRKLHPDLVLMDLVMPNYDGFYGIEKIREFDPKSKIMIISASLTHAYIQKLLEMNVNSISLKPYDLNNIIEIINKVNHGIEVQKVPTAFSKNN